MPGGREQERPRAVGALGLTRGEARLGEQGGLLIDTRPGDRYRLGAEGSCLADVASSGHDGRQGCGVDTERLACGVAPRDGIEVEEERAAGGGGVGDERAAQPVQ